MVLLAFLVVVACMAGLPMIRDKPGLYWISLAVLSIVLLAATALASGGPLLAVNSTFLLTLFLIVVPATLAYAVCALPFFGRRPRWITPCFPVVFVVSGIASMNLALYMRLMTL